jgi:hypothetical protein
MNQAAIKRNRSRLLIAAIVAACGSSLRQLWAMFASPAGSTLIDSAGAEIIDENGAIVVSNGTDDCDCCLDGCATCQDASWLSENCAATFNFTLYSYGGLGNPDIVAATGTITFIGGQWKLNSVTVIDLLNGTPGRSYDFTLACSSVEGGAEWGMLVALHTPIPGQNNYAGFAFPIKRSCCPPLGEYPVAFVFGFTTNFTKIVLS